jgi:hypothetical protein
MCRRLIPLLVLFESNGVDQWGKPFAFRDTHDVLVQDLLYLGVRERAVRRMGYKTQTIRGNGRRGGVGAGAGHL